MRLLQNKCCNGIVILSEDKFVAKLDLSVYTFTTLTLWVVFSFRKDIKHSHIHLCDSKIIMIQGLYDVLYNM